MLNRGITSLINTVDSDVGQRFMTLPIRITASVLFPRGCFFFSFIFPLWLTFSDSRHEGLHVR